MCFFSLGAFAKLRKAIISFVMSVFRPSIHLSLSGYHWTDFHEIWYLSIFPKFVDKFFFWLKSDKNKRHFTWIFMHIYNISLNSYWNEKCFRLKWIKPTDALNSNFIGITTLHVSGSLSVHHQEFWALRRLWYIICSYDDRMLPGVGWHWMCSVVNGIDRSCEHKN